MRLRLTRPLLAAALAAAVDVSTAEACEAPRIPDGQLSALSGDIGRGSYHVEPSTVIVRLTFTTPDAAPAVDTIYAGGDSRFVEGVIAEARMLRAPCATAATPATSVETKRLSVRYSGFENYRAAEPRLKNELQLADVVRLVKDLKSQQVKFDLREMACPFRVRFAPYQPYQPNMAVEDGSTEPSRTPLLEWLRTVTLAIPRDMMVTAIGRASLVTVPCAVLDLS